MAVEQLASSRPSNFESASPAWPRVFGMARLSFPVSASCSSPKVVSTQLAIGSWQKLANDPDIA